MVLQPYNINKALRQINLLLLHCFLIFVMCLYTYLGYAVVIFLQCHLTCILTHDTGLLFL